MQKVFLGLGSNLGNRPDNLERAVDAIASLHGVVIVAQADTIETPPMGEMEQANYLNTVIAIETSYAPRDLLERLQQIELDLGRMAKEDRVHWGPRIIDIDILLFDDQQIDEPGLIVPHPGMHERLFVLKPLVEIAPLELHSVLGQTATQMLDMLTAKMTPTSSGGVS